MKSNSSLSGTEASQRGGSDQIAAQTFSFRDLAVATRNFRADCLLGEGGFGRVYRGRLETNQVDRSEVACQVFILIFHGLKVWV